MLSTEQALALLHLRSVGRKTVHQLRGILPGRPNDLGEMADMLRAIEHRVPRFRAPSVGALRTAVGRARALIDASAAAGVGAMGYGHRAYPDRLRRVSDPPAVLFFRGDPAALSAGVAVAVVGTRKPTDEGREWARLVGLWAAGRPAAVVSGLALGCDAAAHGGCMDVDGVGVAVLAHGLHTVSPASNRWLAEAIVDGGGCLVSEYCLGEPARPGHFVERDRIQSGLADLVVVAETTETGGTMHTARFALSQGRPLACYWSEASGWHAADQSGGNRALATRGEAVPVRSPADLDDLLKGDAAAPCDITRPAKPSGRVVQGNLFGARV